MERTVDIILAFSNALWRLLAEASKKHGLSPLQGQIALYLAKRGEASVTQIARELAVSISTASESLKSMIKLGYVEVARGRDKRVKVVRLTEAGRRAAEEISSIYDALSVVVSRLNYAERALLHMLYAKIVGELIDKGLIETPRACVGCQFLDKAGELYICRLAERPLGRATAPR
ncbi:transcriptional regulator, conjectural [Pyrobaculum aerophilum str. IM2]|uniref:Transcriptional regulator, conjectural n=1 Tax=Pyrobaculum aerophilum (strain ATCC 51768 / DSM 7523 / JCM 9630 / CIP 104966 / NBRC 100827 / IM2) TaxID=178306 RepID=Q8ZUP6_PYRAE|nr:MULTISPECIES: MarR family transcriptional regulator [Pyrobaculum]AAL64360.1 transcriptional regulator, conjectural [Pyrobaculum aerophilum str. IM2]